MIVDNKTDFALVVLILIGVVSAGYFYQEPAKEEETIIFDASLSTANTDAIRIYGKIYLKISNAFENDIIIANLNISLSNQKTDQVFFWFVNPDNYLASKTTMIVTTSFTEKIKSDIPKENIDLIITGNITSKGEMTELVKIIEIPLKHVI